MRAHTAVGAIGGRASRVGQGVFGFGSLRRRGNRLRVRVIRHVGSWDRRSRVRKGQYCPSRERIQLRHVRRRIPRPGISRRVLSSGERSVLVRTCRATSQRQWRQPTSRRASASGGEPSLVVPWVGSNVLVLVSPANQEPDQEDESSNRGDSGDDNACKSSVAETRGRPISLHLSPATGILTRYRFDWPRCSIHPERCRS